MTDELTTDGQTEQDLDSLDALVAASPIPCERVPLASNGRWATFQGLTIEQHTALLKKHTVHGDAELGEKDRVDMEGFRESYVALTWVRSLTDRTRVVVGDEEVAKLSKISSAVIMEMAGHGMRLSGAGEGAVLDAKKPSTRTPTSPSASV